MTNVSPTEFTPVQKFRRGLIFALLATFSWSTTGILIDKLTSQYHITALELSAWRGLLITAALALYIRWRNPAAFSLSRAEIPYYMLYGLIGVAIFNVIWSVSVEVNRAAVATALIFSSPVFVAIGAWKLFKEKLKTLQVAAIVINLIGCALVSGVSDPAALLRNPAGMLLGLGSGLTFGAFTLFGKNAARKGRRSSLTVLFYVFFFATIFLLVVGFVVEGFSLLFLQMDWVGWVMLIGLALGPTLAGNAFFTSSLTYLPAAFASLIGTLEPPITAVLALVILNRSMDGTQWLGTSLIISGVVIMQSAPFVGRLRQASAGRQL